MTAPTPTPPPSPEALKASYGFVGAMAAADPELKKILDQAVAGQWTPDRFIMAVAGSNWYKQNGDAARQMATLKATDPATFQQKLSAVSQNIDVLEGQLGVQLSGKQRAEVANWRLLNPDMDAATLKAHIYRNYFSGFQDWHNLQGDAANVANQLQEVGRQYGWDDFDNYQESRQWLDDIMKGENTLDGFKRRMMDYAKVKYPALHDQLLSGMTVKQIAEPYLQEYSKILEVPQTAINWYDDKLISKALQTAGPGGNGAKNSQSTGTMPIYQFQDELRKDPRWGKTDNAKEAAANVIQKIGKDWGFFGG